MPNILVICAEKIPSVEVGVIAPLKGLKEKKIIEFTFCRTVDVRRKHLNACDILIIVRGADFLEYRIAEAARTAGKYLIYFIDDDLLNIPSVVQSSLYYNCGNISDNIKQTIGQCHLLWTTNPNLERKYSEYCSKTVKINGVALLAGMLPRCRKDSLIRIGFAGGIDHSKTLDQIIAEPIKRIKKEFGEKVEFYFVGAKPRVAAEIEGIKHFPYMSNHQEYKELMCSLNLDIGLAPLPDGDFYNCKYYNKFLEYGAIGACGIYSNMEPYTFAVKHLRNGMLCENTPEAWYSAIKTLIENPEQRFIMVQNAKCDIEGAYTSEKVAIMLEELVPEISTYVSPHMRVEIKRLSPILNRVSMMYEKTISILKTHGFIGFLVIFEKLFKKIVRKINSE